MSRLIYVPSNGLNKEIMIIGEAPGAEEEKIGTPFAGRSGDLLNKLLSTVNLTKNDVYITNVVKVRPLNNRTPSDSELRSWTILLEDEIHHLKPKVIVTLGLSAAKVINYNYELTMDQARGNLWKKSTYYGDITILSTYHPSYALRKPSAKKLIIEDLAVLKELV